MRGSLLVATVVVVADQITKQWAVTSLERGNPRPVWWTLQWNLHFNPGMAFSRGTSFGPIIGVVALVFIAVMVSMMRKQADRWTRFAVGLIVGGAMGNVADRLFRGEGWLRGHVVDFIDLQWWPIWNIADAGVSVGGVLLVLASVFASRQAASQPPDLTIDGTTDIAGSSTESASASDNSTSTDTDTQ